ncbi:hypothetical protein P154DRAFT_225148 [Amniculicola lignicola CBS 123094]|uniref:Uncharacterized protein n=1 Tax=Amniculicola lignicola CBS 123094 TaxID=1392246 RepID=A0A6A5X012_9PLEO|nr:hypothetical protein P154DRAFT_225148 [Amniculicola lignicola CBS 123094]
MKFWVRFGSSALQERPRNLVGRREDAASELMAARLTSLAATLPRMGPVHRRTRRETDIARWACRLAILVGLKSSLELEMFTSTVCALAMVLATVDSSNVAVQRLRSASDLGLWLGCPIGLGVVCPSRLTKLRCWSSESGKGHRYQPC